MRHSYSTISLSFIVFVAPLMAFADVKAAELPKHAIEQSQLTLPGSRPFHLKARVYEATNPDNDKYNAEIEEFWASPDKWRRTIKSSGFSETLIVSGENRSDEITGDYFPMWLRTIVTAMLDPGAALEGVDLTKSSDNPVIGTGEFCRRFASRVGIPPVGNNVFSSYCFKDGLLSSIDTPGYHAEYQRYKKFGAKRVAMELREYLEPGEEVGAAITELSELSAPDESLFVVTRPSKPLHSRRLNEQTLRSLAISPSDPIWPPIRGGKTSGVLSIYVSLDREGHVRETSGLNSDHPDMTDAARAQVSSWQFKRALSDGEPVQVEGILTFAYQTKVGDPYPVLSNQDARKLTTQSAEPQFGPSVPAGTVVTFKVLVGQDGEIHTGSPVGKWSPEYLAPILKVVHQWRFRPYVRDGKPTEFEATLEFVAR